MYAYNFRPTYTGINHREIFVAMSFDSKYDNVYDKLIVPATEIANRLLGNKKDLALEAYRTKDDIRTQPGWINVLEHLTTAQIILGVLSGDNPNVFYELGIAHATQPITRQILIANKGYHPRFDIKDLIYFPYNANNLQSCINDLGEKIAEAIRSYELEKEKLMKKTRQQLGPYEFEVLMAFCGNSHFPLDTSEKAKIVHEKVHGNGSHSMHCQGLSNMCRAGIIGLNTIKRDVDNRTRVEYSYYWTNLGNDLLYYMDLIGEELLMERRSKLPYTITD